MYRKISFYAVVFFMLISSLTCSEQSRDFDITVDLANEMGAGMFEPEQGDSIFISGNFNDWSTTSHPLEASNNEWEYGINVNHLVNLEDVTTQVSDTLEYKFYIKSENQSKLLNTGWESISNRKHVIGDLIIEKPTLIFDDLNPVVKTRDAMFTVGMSNQHVLGFFEPDSGDIVVVTGSFINWDPRGIPLQKTSREFVYAATIPIPEKNVEYKYRILSNRDEVRLNDGWEKIANRALPASEKKTGFSYFDNTSRVLRFQLDCSNLIEKGNFASDLGDQLQIKLKIDGQEVLSEMLIESEKNVFETSVIIPERVLNVEWKAILNLNESISNYKEIDTPIKGSTVKQVL
tara:strand:- start:13869 stop:14909 length:1041 start_codon:yes stop_codon:yes gene_type:complete